MQAFWFANLACEKEKNFFSKNKKKQTNKTRILVSRCDVLGIFQTKILNFDERK